MKRWDPALPLDALTRLGEAARLVAEGARLPPGEGPADAIVVLGARVLPGGEPSGSLRARALAGAALFHERRAPLVVTTGASHLQPPGEAVVARALLLGAGVPAEAVVMEEKSRNTWGNLLFARPLVPGPRVYLVTEPFHLGRALLLARRLGFDPLPWPVLSPAWSRPGSRARLLARDTLSLSLALAEGGGAGTR